LLGSHRGDIDCLYARARRRDCHRTCSGVAAFYTPPRWLKAGDTVRIEFDGIGAIENLVIDEPGESATTG